ncbi:MAG: hypothetical protein QM757_09085 [Paludibaculum sp.]
MQQVEVYDQMILVLDAGENALEAGQWTVAHFHALAFAKEGHAAEAAAGVEQAFDGVDLLHGDGFRGSVEADEADDPGCVDDAVGISRETRQNK